MKDNFDVNGFTAENSVVVYKSLELQYNPESKEYEIYLKIPFCDENGNEVKSASHQAIAHYHFSPMYCILSKDIHTLEEFDKAEFNKTKKEKLTELIAKIEQL